MNLSQKIKFPLNRRSVSFLFLGFSVLFLFSLPLPASAGVWDVVVGGLTAIPTLVVLVVLAFVLLLSQTFAFISSAILGWVLSPNFVAISYTSPVDRGLPSDAGYLPGNPIIKIGLDIIKSGVNLYLVLFLIYIAVAIALRLGGEGSAKKMLVRLILVALLVNFAPILVGLVIDASNIAMNSTLAGVGTGFSDTAVQFSVWGNGLVTKLLRIPTFAGQMGLLAQVMVMVALNFAIGLALLLYAGLFIFRYIIIWILVIFSPVAFVSLIHPFFKKMVWDIWWKQLWEWSFVGAFMAFFLYLGAQAIRLIPTIYKQPITMAGFSPDVAGAFSQSLPYFVVLVFLYLGFTMGLQTGAMGANTVIGLGKRTGGWVGGKVWRGASTWAQEKTRFREAAGAVTKKWEEIPVARWFLPDAMRKYSEMRPAVDEAQKKASAFSSLEIGHRIAVGDIYGKDAVGGITELIQRGDFQDYIKSFGIKYFGDKWDKAKSEGGKNQEDLFNLPEFREKTSRFLQIALRSGRHNTLLRGDPRLGRIASEAGIYKFTQEEKTLADGTPLTDEEAGVRRAVLEARRQHVTNWEREVVEDPLVIRPLMEKGREMWEAVNTQVKKGQESSLKVIDKLFTEFIDKAELPHANSKDVTKAWETFREDYQKKVPGLKGYFVALEDKRFSALGWRKGSYLSEKGPIPAEPPKTQKGKKPGEVVGIGEGERTEGLFEETQKMKEASEKKEREAKK